MGNTLRDRDPSLFHLITTRTEQQRYFLRPSKDVNKILGGIVARYQEICKIEIYGYCFMSNHPHLLAKAPLGNLDEFMENVNREIARRINYKLRRKGNFWSKPYKPLAVKTDKDLEEALVYIITNPVKHGAARHPSRWRGLSSYGQSLSEEKKTYSFHHYSEVDEDKKVTYHDLVITPLPKLAEMTKDERISYLSAQIEARTELLVAEREAKGQGFMSEEQVREVDPFSSPKQSNHTPTGGCYSKDPEVIREFKRIERERRASYSLASMRYRLGDLTVTFPEFTFKPPLHRKPRFKRFQPLPDDYFQKSA